MGKIKYMLGKLKQFWSHPMKGRYLPLKEVAGFCAYTLGVSFLINVVNYVATVAYIPYFYEIDTIHAYIIVALGTFINMLLQPLIGNAIEKTNTKYGRYKPFILFALPIFALLAILVTWIPQVDSTNARIVYAYLTCVPVLVLSTFFNNMYQTMPTIITPDSQERADIMTPVGLVFGFAPSVLQIIAGPIRAAFMKQGQEYIGMRLIGIISVIIGILCVIAIIKVKERVYTNAKQNEKIERVTTKEALKLLWKNKPLKILCLALILGSLREFTGVFRYLIVQFRFSESVKTALDISGIPMTIIGFGSTVAMVLLPIATRKLDKKYIIIAFTMISVIANGILGFVGYENFAVGTESLIVITILHFMCQITPVYLLIPVMLGEIADYQQSISGKRLEGHLQNLLFTIPSLCSQLFMIGAWFWQKAIGFEAKEYANCAILSASQQAIACQWFDAVGIISAISGLLLVIIIFFYPLSRKKHAEIVEQLKSTNEITNTEDNAIEQLETINTISTEGANA